MRKRRIAGWIVIGAAVAAGLWFRPDRALHVAAAMTAQNLCGAAFIQNVDPDATFRQLIKPMSSVAGPLLRYRIDRSGKAVEASILGVLGARSQWTQGYGCRLIWDRRVASPTPVAARPPSAPDGLAPPTVVSPADPALVSALDAEFAEAPGQPPRRVKAVVILKDGKVVAERYATGFGVDTPLLSYSVAKSFGNAFLAILVRQGKLRVDQPVGAPEWSRPGDPRAALTLDDLLRMQSGLNAAESGSGFDPASQMLYGVDDMAHFAAGHPLKEPPRTHFEYTSSDTLILDRVLGQAVGGGAAGFRAFADRELFQPLHMDGVTLEFDGAGTFSGSAYVYAPARAYVRLGLLYMNDGIAPDGRRLLPEGWVAYSRKSTLGSPYGAGFWTLDGPSDQAAFLVGRGFPKDGFYASGNRGQRIYVVPSEKLVMVRFGYSTPPSFGIREDMALLKTAIARLRHT
jgi:CubicO group peptidase (beta-lactamase class C family)